MMAKRDPDHDKDQELDPAGERGGDTGPSSYKGDGPQAEKGDQRRDTPVHSGPTRRGAKQHSRSGSDSNESEEHQPRRTEPRPANGPSQSLDRAERAGWTAATRSAPSG